MTHRGKGKEKGERHRTGEERRRMDRRDRRRKMRIGRMKPATRENQGSKLILQTNIFSGLMISIVL